MSHHLDSPIARQDVRLDITDLYVFRGEAGTVFVINVCHSIAEAHLHAVWLAETGKELSPDIPHVLDLSAASLPVQEETEFGITLAAPP